MVRKVTTALVEDQFKILRMSRIFLGPFQEALKAYAKFQPTPLNSKMVT